MTRTTIELQIKRQDRPGSTARWERFSLPYRPQMNVISCLMEIRRSPVTREGAPTTPVSWDANCLEQVCGACSMLVNGTPRQACAALVDRLPSPIVLEPLSKFPLVRDLITDRQEMFDALTRVQAWIPIDGTYDLGPGPRLSAAQQQIGYAFARCMTCGCCMEACPQYNDRSSFIGPAPLAQVRLFNAHPTGAMNRDERLHAIMGEGGISDCGNAQNCVQVCPKEIPLTDAIAHLGQETTAQWLKDLFSR